MCRKHLNLFLLVTLTSQTLSFTFIPKHSARTQKHARLPTLTVGAQKEDGRETVVQEYKNAPTSILANFMQKEEEDKPDPLANIDFNAPKIGKLPIDTLAAMLDAELYEKEWFVTGNVNPVYFADEFEFQDPDVKLSGIEDYARGVYKLFDQETSRAEIISTVVNDQVKDSITVTWRLSGKVNIGPGLTIKPYICYTDFKVDTEGSGLITFQEDRFDIPQWDILLSALFPFLIGKVTSDPAPPVPIREIPMMPKAQNNGFSFDSILGKIFN